MLINDTRPHLFVHFFYFSGWQKDPNTEGLINHGPFANSSRGCLTAIFRCKVLSAVTSLFTWTAEWLLAVSLIEPEEGWQAQISWMLIGRCRWLGSRLFFYLYIQSVWQRESTTPFSLWSPQNSPDLIRHIMVKHFSRWRDGGCQTFHIILTDLKASSIILEFKVLTCTILHQLCWIRANTLNYIL